MITYVDGNLFKSPAHVLVNTVNTVGVMGKGVAKEFKRLFPDMFQKYRDLCEEKKFDIGNLFLYRTDNKWVLNFPTKKHWRSPSRPEYIDKGLQKLVSIYLDMGIYDLAMPLIGCGHGELDWPTQVKPIVEKYMKTLPVNVFVYVYASGQAPVPEHRNVPEMETWLRSEPAHLPFAEVWLDLLQVLEQQTEFRTLAGKNNKFQAAAVEDPQGILIKTDRTKAFFDASDLLDFLAATKVLRLHIAPDCSVRTVSKILLPDAYLRRTRLCGGGKHVRIVRTSMERLQDHRPAIRATATDQLNEPVPCRQQHISLGKQMCLTSASRTING